MATNFYFNNFTNSGEQNLIEDLIIESIRVYGHDLWYIPRTLVAKDELLNEDDLSTFTRAFMIEAYIKNVDSFGGDGDLLSKFGLRISDTVTFTVAIRKFNEDVALYDEQIRPNEGDLIYFPLNNKIFEVQHVEHEAIFYQMGSLQTYDLRCELFEYSQERFNTGVLEIDTLFNRYILTTNSAIANVESVDFLADNFTIETIADNIVDFTEENPFGESNY
jgi:hypothetical protein